MPYKSAADQAAYARKHYEANRGAYLARAKTANKAKHEAMLRYVREIKAQPCGDCGIAYPFYVMQFDHREPAEKAFNIGDLTRAYGSWTALKAEIAKCDVVCANCHAERTHQRGQDETERVEATIPRLF